jgi:hypothetical protein
MDEFLGAATELLAIESTADRPDELGRALAPCCTAGPAVRRSGLC